MSKRKTVIIVAVLILLIVGIAWAVHRRSDPQLEKVRQMRQELFAGGRPDPARFQQLREEIHKLTDAQQQQLHEEGAQRWQQHRDKEIEEYFKLPPEKRLAELDRRIQEMERRQKEWEQRRAQQGQGGGAQGSQGPGAQSQNGGPGNPNAPGGARGRPGNRTPDARSSRQNQRLDNSSPAKRAQRMAYFAAIQQRRIELGLPAWPPHGSRQHPPGR